MAAPTLERIRFERRLDSAAKQTVDQVLRSGDPIEGRLRLRALLQKVAREAARQPLLFEGEK